MHFKLKALAVAAAGTAVCALALSGSSAHAETQVCGYYCVTMAAQSLGSGQVIAVSSNAGVLMAPGFVPGEDFVGLPMGTVAQLAQSGQVPSSLTAKYGSEVVYELVSAPHGALTGDCLGIAGTSAGAGIKLQFCGSPVNGLPTPQWNAQKGVLWIGVHADSHGNFEPFVNVAASTAGSNGSLALTAGAANGPLSIQPLTGASNQMWESLIGIFGATQAWPTPAGPMPVAYNA